MAAIYKRGRTWWGRVQRQGQELRQSLKTTSPVVARRRLTTWLDELDAVAFGEKPRRTYDDAMLRFVEEHLPTLKPGSAKRYLVSIEALTDELEGTFLDKLGSARLSEFVANRIKKGARVDRQGGRRKAKAITPSTIRRDLACLSSMFGCCMEWEWVEHNPVPAFLRARKKRGLREGAPKTRWLTTAEEAALLESVATSTDPDAKELHAAIIVAIDTGM